MHIRLWITQLFCRHTWRFLGTYTYRIDAGMGKATTERYICDKCAKTKTKTSYT